MVSGIIIRQNLGRDTNQARFAEGSPDSSALLHFSSGQPVHEDR
jgi:hypothetical protein